MTQLPSDLGVRLGMRTGADVWLQQIGSAPEIDLPDDATARDLMSLCSVGDEDQEAFPPFQAELVRPQQQPLAGQQ